MPKPPLSIIWYNSIYLFLSLCYYHVCCLLSEVSVQNCCKYFLCRPPEGYFQPITTSWILLFCFCEQAWHLQWHSVVSMQMLGHLPSAVLVEDTLHHGQLMFRLNEDLVTTALVHFLCFLQTRSAFFDYVLQLNALLVYYIFSHSSTCFEPCCAHHQEGLLYIHSIWFFICHSS